MIRLLIIIILYIVTVQEIVAAKVDVDFPVVEYMGVQVATIQLPSIVKEASTYSIITAYIELINMGLVYLQQSKGEDGLTNL